MPRHDDIFDFSPQALERVQQAHLNGVRHCYIGTDTPGVVFFFALETEPRLRGQGRYLAYAKALNEHCDATGTTRIAAAMSRGDVPLEKLVDTYVKLGFEVIGEPRDTGLGYLAVDVMRKPQPITSP